MADRVRFGIIGCGGIGGFHASLMHDMDLVTLVAVSDIIPDHAEKLGTQYGVDWYDNNEALLARTDIDAVSICTPSGLHAELGMQAARAGKHVLSEKPMDVYVEQIDALVATCAAAGVKLGGIFQNRYPRALQQVKKAIEDGWLGDIVFASASTLWYRAQAYYDSSDWRGTWALDAGCLSNQAIHMIDRLVWLTDMQPEVLSAYCPTLTRNMEAEDLGVALLKFPNGAGGVVQGTTLANPGLTEGVTVCGTKGSVVTEGNRVTFFAAEGAPEGLVEVERPGGESGAGDPAAAWGGAHVANITEFARAILEGREPIVSGAEARKAVQLLNDIYRVAQVGPWAPKTCCSGCCK